MILDYASDTSIPAAQAQELLQEALAGVEVAGKRVLVIIPDNTRTLPMPALFAAIAGAFSPRAAAVTFLIALGTHPPLTDDELHQHLGPRMDDFPNVRIIQHEWDNPRALVRVGTITRGEMVEISRGLLSEEVPITINRAVLDLSLIHI